MKVIIRYSRLGVELNVPEGASKDEMIQTYLRTYGCLYNVFNHFLRYASFVEDTTSDAIIIEEPKNKEIKDE